MKKLLVLLLILGLATPVMAAEWSFYGSARIATFWEDVDRGDDLTRLDDKGLSHGLAGNSRIGAQVKVNDQIGGGFEYGASGGNPNIRLLYGTYNFGSGRILVGQDYTPMVPDFISNQVYLGDDNLWNIGAPDDSRLPQIKLTIGAFEAALIQPNLVQYAYDDEDVVLPKIEVTYKFSTDTLLVMPLVGFQTYKIENNLTDDSETINSYVVGWRSNLNLGPVYINTAGTWSQNAGNFGMGRDPYAFRNNIDQAQLVGNDIEDAKTLDLALVAGFKINDQLNLEAGVGYANSKVDIAAGIEAKQTMMCYYLQAVVTVAPGFSITPEIGYYDLGDYKQTGSADLDMGGDTYIGAKFQIDF